ncbi:MAG: LppA family lipoprotein [Haloechinothrix sp.]
MTIRALVSLFAAVLLCGCVPEGRDINDNPNAGTVEDQYRALAQRPDIEQATEQWSQLLQEVRDLLSEEYGLPEWQFREGNRISRAGCGFDFPDISGDGEARNIRGGYSEAPIPAGSWDEAVTKVGEIAKRYGFTGVLRIADKGNYHEVEFSDPNGTRLNFGAQVNTSLSLGSGCYLTAEAKRRDAPEPQ